MKACKVLKVLGAAAVAALLPGGCATATRLTSVWTDESYAGGPVGHVLVVAVSESAGGRRLMEEHFAAELQGAGIKALSSASVLPADTELDREAVVAAVKQAGADSVLLTHLLGVEQEQVYRPPATYQRSYGRPLYGHYHNVYEYVHTPGYYTTHPVVRLETNLYDARTEKPVWSAQSETFDPQSLEQVVDGLVAVVIGELRKNGLIP